MVLVFLVISALILPGKMADNYLEKKMEEFKAMSSAGVAGRSSSKTAATLGKLVAKNIHYKSFDNKIIVRLQHLKELAEFSKNGDGLLFHPTVDPKEVSLLLEHLRVSDPNWLNYNSPQNLPKAFLILGCDNTAADASSTTDNNAFINLGITLQTILLRAVEMGLNGTFTTSFDAGNVAQMLSLQFKPSAIIALGKGA